MFERGCCVAREIALADGTERERVADTRSAVALVSHTLGELLAELAPGDRLPAETALARQLGVSRAAVRLAMETLVREGRIERRRGSGTRVCSPVTPSPQADPPVAVMFHATALRSPSYYYGELLAGVNEALWGLGIPHRLVETPAKWWEAPELADTAGLIVLHPLELTSEEAVAVPLLSKPVVLIATQAPGVTWVDTDNRTASANAVSYLANLGHRRIACVTTQEPLTNSLHRVEGYREMAARLGLAVEPHWVVELDDIQPETVWVEQLGRLMGDSASRPTALLVNGYPLALHTIRALRQLGYGIPDDLSIVGFDDPESAAHLTPPLTTVAQPIRLLGALAVWKLLELRNTGRSYVGGCLPCALIVRGSCIPPRTA